ncbi:MULTISPECIES: CcoQ/FixQ family Cbb3-type cytochrome c oxidase assembly chaperone [Filomicrobium]|uniref:Cytochrome c oxidase cbb3-type subunit 4 n=1 Tax=Filomicrobium insigne TaxID=418854 RepID=A0A1H0QR98_9HYPH|nr:MULTISPECIES: CcoQ/FixQ family Cbb3-type cytochrome c oxidase assembly chaperone [Filomicrobium]MCV0369546.1 CcoQ/FixQ family Cbb3-type cytochrome c oxidase assembly chaperone [Filomicrobium sp.]SDP19854.1 cytochrome c oxidase cbb3-type subunit 4 [Filomicrobium insigne]
MDYHSLREFADSWGLLFLTVFFLGVVVFAFRPGSKKAADEAARIPLKDD